MRAFVFPGQGGSVAEPDEELLPKIRRIVGERIPDQVKFFARAAQDADESRELAVRPGCSRRSLSRRVRRSLCRRML